MASENQLAALGNWLKGEIPAGEAVCEMPGEVCSDALSRLHEASEKYKEDKKTNYGLVLATKKAIVSELREQGWIGVPISEGEEKEKKVEKAPELPKKPDAKEVFGERAEAEAEKIRDEQGRGKTIEEEEKHPTLYKAEQNERITIMVTHEIPAFMGTDGKIYSGKPGVKKIPKENAEALIKRGVATKEVTEPQPQPQQQPTVAEIIEKYGDIRAQVTEYVRTNERIPEREKGYAINWISDKVIDALERGGDQE